MSLNLLFFNLISDTLNDYYHGTHNYHHPNDGLEWSTYSVIFLHGGTQTGAIWRILVVVRGHQADCSLFVSPVHYGGYALSLASVGGGAGNLQVGFLSRGKGSEVGSKVTKSISCELLRASSVVTHHGAQAWWDTLPPSLFFCFLPSFPRVSPPILPSHEHTILTHTLCPVRLHIRITTPFLRTHMHWSLSSPLLECSLVSAVMQSSPVISWELCVLHSLPSVLFFFLY